MSWKPPQPFNEISSRWDEGQKAIQSPMSEVELRRILVATSTALIQELVSGDSETHKPNGKIVPSENRI